jgi:hypothetical protein
MSVAARLHLGHGKAGGQDGRHRYVRMTDESICGVCHKKLGGGGARNGNLGVVAALPNNKVVHYGCLSRATGHKADGVKAPAWGRGF